MAAIDVGELDPVTDPYLPFLSLSGLDEGVPISEIVDFSLRYPITTWGVLLSYRRAGQPDSPRYPSIPWIRELMANRGSGEGRVKVALHICGSDAVRDFIHDGDQHGLLKGYHPLQLNFDSREYRDDAIEKVFVNNPYRCIITQHNNANAHLAEMVKAPYHAILFDSSLGAGIPMSDITQALPGKLACGYAGGFGPDNLEDMLPRIFDAARGAFKPWFVDMESRLRDENDRFDMVRAAQCAEIIDRYRGDLADSIIAARQRMRVSP